MDSSRRHEAPGLDKGWFIALHIVLGRAVVLVLVPQGLSPTGELDKGNGLIKLTRAEFRILLQGMS